MPALKFRGTEALTSAFSTSAFPTLITTLNLSKQTSYVAHIPLPPDGKYAVGMRDEKSQASRCVVFHILFSQICEFFVTQILQNSLCKDIHKIVGPI